MGKSLRCDFVLLQSYSGGWHVRFVELEPVKDLLYNKDRTPSRRLRIALKQIADWQNYVHHDLISLKTQLADVAKEKNCLDPHLTNRFEPSSFSGKKLRDPKTFIHFYYHIVIGRRSHLSETADELRCGSFYHNNVEIVTYDRFAEVAKQREDYRQRILAEADNAKEV